MARRKAGWSLWALAVLLLVLAASITMLSQPVEAQSGPTFDIDVPMSGTTINYETAKVQFTITDLPSSITDSNWIVSINWSTPADRYGDSKRTGPGMGYTPDEGDTFEATFSNGTITAGGVALKKMIPDSEYTLKVELYERHSGGSWLKRGEGSTTFRTKAGCTAAPNADDLISGSTTRPAWFGLYYVSHVTETELTVVISANRAYAPENSGRCLYYNYNEFGGGTVGPNTAYFHYMHGSSRRAVITLTGLKPGTKYSFTLSVDGGLREGNVGISGTTLGENTGISDIDISNVTQSRADAMATIRNASSDDKIVYMRVRTSPEGAEEEEKGRWNDQDSMTVKGNTAKFGLSGLDAGTRYEVEASVKTDYSPGMSHSVYFVTLPGQPTIDSVEEGDTQLTVNWTAPPEAPAPITGYRVQWQEEEEYYSIEFPPPTDTRDHHDAAADDTSYTITGLTNGTEYIIHVIAKNESFDDYGGTASNEEYGTPMSLPGAPRNLDVAEGNKKLTLTWEAPTASPGVTVTGYKLQWKANTVTSWDATTGVTEVSVSGLTREITGLDISTAYDVRVRADNGISSDTYSWANGAGTTLPDTPENLTVASGDRQLTLSWEEPADLGSVAITGYVVQYRKTSETSWTTSSAANQESTDSLTNETTYSNTIAGLDYSTDYDVQVRADNGVTLEDEDNYNWAEGDGKTIPDSPGDFEVTPGNEKLTLAWTAPPPSGSLSINGFFVQYKKPADSGWTSLSVLSASALGTVIPNLDNDVLYSVRVRAINEASLEDEDDYNWATGSGTPVPEPSITTVTVDANSITQTGATVTVTLDRANGVTQNIKLQYRTIPNGTWSTPPESGSTDTTSAEIVLNALEGNTVYEVQAWLETDSGTKVKSASFTTKPVPPSVPTNSRFTPGNTIIELEWDPPTDPGGTAVTHYVIEWVEFIGHNWETSTLESATTTEEEYEITGLTNGTEYAIRLRADNGTTLPAGKSYNWLFASRTPSTKPGAPTLDTVTPAPKKLTAEWSAPGDDGGSDITGYKVQWKANTVTNWDAQTGVSESSAGADDISHEITGLDNGTTYDVRVIAVNENGDSEGSNVLDGTPRPDPSLSKVEVQDATIKQTAATATVTIADPTGDAVTVNLRYRVSSPVGTWKTVTPMATTTASLEFPEITGLKSDTLYRVEASFDSNFASGVEFTTFTTKRPTIADVEVADSTIEQTEATATVTIEAPNDRSQTVYLRYRPTSQNDWSTTASDAGTEMDSTSTNSVNIDISSLKSDTEYEVQASLESDYSQSDTAIFTTDPPTLTSIIISEVMQESAKATVTIQEPHGRSLPVYVRYRKVTDPVNTNWTSADTSSTTTSAVSSFTDLTSATKYEAQASLDSTFPSPGTVTSDPFTTKDPTLSGLTPMNITTTSADIEVAIEAPSGESLTINYRYRPASQSDWSTTAADAGSGSTSSTTDTATISLSGLHSNTPYQVQVTLDSDLDSPTLPVLPASFATLSTGPSISDVVVSERTETGAKVTVTVANPETNGNTVHLRYKINGTSSWTTPSAVDADPNDALFDLSSLRQNTTYDLETSLDSGFANSTTASFKTLKTPIISSVGVDDITKTTATATVAIDNPDGIEKTVNLRHRKRNASPADTWKTEDEDSSGTSQEFSLTSLDPGTTYEVEASFDANFTTGVEDTDFTTTPEPSISSVIVDDNTITKTTATATVNIADPDGESQTVHLRYIEESNTPDWDNDGTTDSTTSTTDTATKTLTGLAAGTAYILQASFDNTFPDGKTKQTTFTTVHKPSISSVSVDPASITTTGATATVNIANPDGESQTVHLRYIENSNSLDWDNDGTTDSTTSTTATATKDLTGLSEETTYILQASFDSNFATGVKSTTFTTEGSPRITSLRVSNVTQTSARLVASLANTDGSQTVYMEYKLSTAQWSNTPDDNRQESSGSATFNLGSLTAGTRYDSRVSLNQNMSDATSRSFTTQRSSSRSPTPQPPQVTRNPEISAVTFSNIAQNSADATVTIDNAGSSQKNVRLHYRENGVTRWTSVPASVTSGASTTFSLSGLTASTTHQVQAWLNTSSPASGTQIYTFTTLGETVLSPSLTDIECENVGQTWATTIVTIANAGSDMKEVYIKHSMDGVNSWNMLPSPSIIYSDNVSIQLTGLQQGTTYKVAVALTNDFNDMLNCSFTTLAAPSLSGVGISNITNTSAVATANIANAGTAQKTVYLRYRKFGESQWGTTRTRTTTGASAPFNLTSLDPRTTYEVQASLESDFGVSKSAVFTTSTPNASVARVNVGSITETSAVATVTIAHAGTAQKIVHLRYRVYGTSAWGTTQTETTTGSSATFDLTGLSPQTSYEVEAALSSNFAASKTTTFSTLSSEPSVSSLTIDDITQTSAVGTVSIANEGTAQKTIYLQYRVRGTVGWSDPALTTTTYGASATIDLTGLTANTDYEAQASLTSDFALAQSATFRTLPPDPSLTSVDVKDIKQTTARAEVEIAHPNGNSLTVHTRYRTTTPQGDWSSTLTGNSTTGEASIELTGLASDTEYELEASLTSDFTVAVSDTFSTLPPDPVVSEVSVSSIRTTTAKVTIDIANSNGKSQTVNLRYRTTTPQGSWSNTATADSTTDKAIIRLSGLAQNTEYEVQASLDDSFPARRTRDATFTTLREPSIETVSVENIARNGATISATIADSQGVSLTVYVRHRDARYILWRPTRQANSVDDVANLRLRGLHSGTEYIAEVSLDDSFPDKKTKSVTFTTKPRRDEEPATPVIAPARVANLPLLGFSPPMLHFVAIEGGENPTPQTFRVWNRVQGAMDFILSDREDWLFEQPKSGLSTGPEDAVEITVSVNIDGLASSQYIDIINIKTSNSAEIPGQVIVVLDVLPPDYIRQFVSRADGAIIVMPDGTVRLIVPAGAPPKDVDIELMKVNTQAHGTPPGESERVAVAIMSNTYPPGGDTPEDVAYSPYVELWLMLPDADAGACGEGRAKVYKVESGTWSLVEHRCHTDESGNVWALAQVERLGAYALVIDDSPLPPTPTPAAAAAPTATPTSPPSLPPALPVQRVSLPALAPTPMPTQVPTPMPILKGTPAAEPTSAPAMEPTPMAEQPAPILQASADTGGSGGFNGMLLAALGLPMLIGGGIVLLLFYRERRRNGQQYE